MGFKIVSDSSSNLLSYPNIDYVSVPLKILAGDKEFIDNEDLDLEAMLQYLKTYKGKSGTACPGQGEWMEAFGDAEQIFCITITSKLSGSYNAARLAKEEYEEMHPNRKVYVIDTMSAGANLKMIVEKIVALEKEGKSFEEICTLIEAYKERLELIFVLESLTNLANNGRVNPAVAKVAGVLGIRVVGAADDGVLNPLTKSRGEKGALKDIIKIVKERGYCGGTFIIEECMNLSMANKLKELILEMYPEAEVRIEPMTGLCSFYAEKGGLIIGYEIK